TGINASGQIVGEGDNNSGSIEHGFIYSGSSFTDLRPLGIYTTSGINSSGQVSATTTAGHAVLYSGGTVTDLGTLGGNRSGAGAINDSGQIVGESRTGGVDTFG